MVGLLLSALAPPAAALPEGDDLTDQAATFGIRAIAQAGLLDPLGQFYGYDGILQHEDRWVIAFRSSTCYRNEQVETCDPNTGTREEHFADAWLEITIRDGMFVITDAFGRFTEEDEAELRAYTEPSTIEPTHLEFPTVRIDPSLHEPGYDIRAVILWAGPLFVRGVWSVCRPEVYDAEGNVLWTGRAIAFDTRPGEYFRSNGLLIMGASEIQGEPARAEMVCELWTQETWVMAGEPRVERFPRRNAVAVEVDLVWEHERIVALDSHCRFELFRADGSFIKAKTVSAETSPWAGRSKTSSLFARLRVGRPRSVDYATVRCLAKGQSFD